MKNEENARYFSKKICTEAYIGRGVEKKIQ
jgi:hypothetical protein